jgi:hypothetical protein
MIALSLSVNNDQERLRPTDLADHDSIGTLAKGFPHEISKCDFGAAVETGLARLHLRHVRQVGVDLEYLFAGDDSSVGRHLAKEAVHHCCLPGSRRTGDEHREILTHCLAEQLRRCGCECFPLDQLIET